MTIIVSKEQVIWDLECYGEIEAAKQIDALDDEQFSELRRLASLHFIGPDRPILAKACALGAVEYLEKAVRPLKRKRRKKPNRAAPKTDLMQIVKAQVKASTSKKL